MAQVLTIAPDKTREVLKKVVALYNADELDEAYALCDKQLMEQPDDPQIINVMAGVMQKAGKIPVALALAKQAATLQPDRPEPACSIGRAYQSMWQLDKAIGQYKRALSLAQNDEQRAFFMNNLCSAYIDCGDFVTAEDWGRKALALDPLPLTKHNLGLALLAQRKWREGWPNYETSVGTAARIRYSYNDPPEPEWDGTPGKRIVVFGEQGLGDEICFASMVPDLCKDNKVVLDCDKRLEGLFRRSFPQAKVYGTRTEKTLNWAAEDRIIETSISSGSVGKFLRNSDADFPGTPYLKACPIRTESWRAYFKTLGKPVIGIAWTGGVWANHSKFRNAPLEVWAPIFKLNAHFVNLEYKQRDTEHYPVATYPWATLTKDYDDTAALVAACDYVVTMQTAVAHLAGGLGKDVRVMVPCQSQWKYGKDYESIPWYKSMRVYHQPRSQMWQSTIKRIAEDLEKILR